jgi:hypothetical protein
MRNVYETVDYKASIFKTFRYNRVGQDLILVYTVVMVVACLNRGMRIGPAGV